MKIWDITFIKEKLGEEVCRNILFIHPLLGCDMTSRIYGLGKRFALNKFQADSNFKGFAKVFMSSDAMKEDVVAVGEKALVSLHGRQQDEGVDLLRVNKFFQKVARNVKSVDSESLPPTSSAAQHHSLRVYHQVQIWKGRDDIDPEGWGWVMNRGRLVSLKTDKASAPKELLKVIRCTCKSDYRMA